MSGCVGIRSIKKCYLLPGIFPEAALDAPGPGDQTAQSRSPGKRERDRGFPGGGA
ncbi:hypothetical protein TUM17563_53570 [Klebsiella oxytoca]|nr:hypothetical protein TUM17563_53570 [Klebsiella oxytoca]